MDGIHEAWSINRFEHADTPIPSHNPNIVACVPLVNSIWLLSSMTFQATHCYGNSVGY